MDAESTIARPPDSLDDLLRRLDFPAVDYPAWKRRVEEELGDTSFAEALVARIPEGVDVEALYARGSAVVEPDLYLGRPAGSEPLIAAEVSIPDPAEAAAEIVADLRYGVVSPWLRVRYAGDVPPDSGSPEAVRIADADALRGLLRTIPAGARPVVEVVGELKPLEPAAEDLGGDFLSDPLGEAFLGGGDAGETLDRALADLVACTLRAAGGQRSSIRRCLLVSTSAHHQAGASAVDELAVALAGGVELLRRSSAAGLAAAEAAVRMTFAFSVAEDLFVEIAKLRAARLLWSKALDAAGVEDGRTWIHARGSTRGFSASDPRTNLLRGTVQYFAASVGGADSIALTPYDLLAEAPGGHGRRLAAMTQHVLAEEAFLGRLADPAAGSWFVESLTDRLARAAWKLFQELESGGGLVHCLRDGRVHEVVRRSAERREAGGRG